MAGLKVLLSSGDIDEYEADDTIDAKPLQYVYDGELRITRTVKVPFTQEDADQAPQPVVPVQRASWNSRLAAAVERGWIEAEIVECVYAAGMWMKVEVMYDLDELLSSVDLTNL